jgi:hypothetical protein
VGLIQTRAGLRAVLFLLALALGLLLATLSLRPPDPLPAGAPPTVFSAGRALKDLDQIAVKPRPTGSAAAISARAIIFARMQALGLHPRVVVGEAVEARRGSVLQASGAHVENLVGVLEGADPSLPVILLMAHTDSVPASPGAADDGAGVAAVLEAVRALEARGRLRRGVGVLLTDGEEAGLLGARAYFRGADPLKSRIGAVINLEARGGGGRAVMFETGAGDGGYMRLFAKSVQNTEALSLMSEIYKVMPNDTDFTVPKKLGLPGFNFAFIGREADYHAPSSTIAALDKGSLQHLGDQALAVVSALGALQALPAKTQDVVYGDVFGRNVLVYPKLFGWVILLVGGGLGAFGALRVIRTGDERIAGWGLLRAALGPCLPVLAALLALHLLHIFMSGDGLRARALLAEPGLFRLAVGAALLGAGLWSWRTLWRGEGRLLLCGAAAAAFALIAFKEGANLPALGLATATALLALLAFRPLTPGAGWLGGLGLLFVVALGLQIFSPAMAILALWPLLFAGVMGAVVAVPGRGDAGFRRAPFALALVGTLLALHLFRLGAVTADAVGYVYPEALALLVLLGGPGFYSLAEGFSAKGRFFASAGPVLMALGAGAMAFALLRDPFNQRTPRPVEAFFLEDVRSGRAYRASSLARLDPWSKAVLEASDVPTSRRLPPAFDRLQLSPSPLAGLQRPTVVIDQAPAGSGVQVSVHLAGGLLARELRLFLQPTGSIENVKADGLDAGLKPKAGGAAELRWAAPSAGLELTFLAKGAQTVRLTLETITDGLPPFMKTPPKAPDEAPTVRSDTSVVLDERVIAVGSGDRPGARP